MGSFFQTDMNGLGGAGDGGNLTLLYDSDAEGLSFPRANIDVQNISQDYLNLLIWIWARTGWVIAVGDLNLYMNNDAVAGNYTYQNHHVANAVHSNTDGGAWHIGLSVGTLGQANATIYNAIRVHNYAATEKRWAMSSFGGPYQAAELSVGMRGLHWKSSTNPVNRLTFSTSAGNLIDPTRLIIMGEDPPV